MFVWREAVRLEGLFVERRAADVLAYTPFIIPIQYRNSRIG